MSQRRHRIFPTRWPKWRAALLRHYAAGRERLMKITALPAMSRRAWQRRVTRLAHWAMYVVGSAVLLASIAFALAWWWLPTLAERKQEVVQYLSERIHLAVEIDQLETFWSGLNPGIRARGFRLAARAGGPQAISLDEVRLILRWRPLLTGRIAIEELALVEPRLAVERLPDNRVRVTGLAAISSNQGTENPVDLVDWLLQQGNIHLEQGELTWIDRVTDAPPLTLKAVSLRLHNDGDTHRASLAAVFPPELCKRCAVVVEVRGNPARDSDWQATVGLDAVGLDVTQLPPVIRDRLPGAPAGVLTTNLGLRWEGGRLAAASGRVSARDLSWTPPQRDKPLALGLVDAALEWEATPSRARLTLNDLRLAVEGAPWQAGRLMLDLREGNGELNVGQLRVRDVARLAQGVMDHPWLANANPAGWVSELRLRWSGSAGALKSFDAQAELAGVSFASVDRLPGASGIDGRLSLEPSQGAFTLRSERASVHLPRFFAEPLALGRVDGRFQWDRTDTAWHVAGSELRVRARDARLAGQFDLRVPHDREQSPVLKLRADLRDGDGTRAAQYYPLTMPEKLRDWLARSLQGGRITNARLLYDGEVRRFPFVDGGGQFEVAAHVSGGVFRYQKDWPPVRDLDVDVLFRNAGMLITANHGRFGEVMVGPVTVDMPSLRSRDAPRIGVAATVSGPQQALLDALRDLPPSVRPSFPATLTAGGRAALSMVVSVPTRDVPQYSLRGSYAVHQGTFGGPSLPLIEGLDGEIRFNRLGLTDGALHARWLGGPMRFEVSRPAAAPPGDFVVAGHGEWHGEKFAEALGKNWAGRLQGRLPWELRFQRRGGIPDLAASMHLDEARLDLPAPLAKKAKQPERLIVFTRSADKSGLIVESHLGTRAHARLALGETGKGWGFLKGVAGLGPIDLALPDTSGLMLAVRLDRFQADPWLRLVGDGTTDAKKADTESSLLSQLRIETGALQLFNREFGQFALTLRRWPTGWHGDVRGAAINGSVVIGPAPEKANGDKPLVQLTSKTSGTGVHLTLSQLTLPPANEEKQPPVPMDPRRLPFVTARVESLQAFGGPLGAAEFEAGPDSDGWSVRRFIIRRPGSEFRAEGHWRTQLSGGQTTDLKLALHSENLGDVLKEFGIKNGVANSRTDVNAEARWQGAPAEFDRARLNGRLSFTMRDGRLLSVEPGAGRLLGIINIGSLSRYLRLDFSNVFGRGFAFDSITGQFTAEFGNAYTRQLILKGPSATIQLSGRVGLANEDLDLDLVITPRLGQELAVTTGVLGGPGVGAAVAVFQELIRRPFEEGIRVKYTVKGPWAEPVVTKLGKSAAAPQPQPVE
jgi:uncharacterized protein (TIGR02099 family)